MEADVRASFTVAAPTVNWCGIARVTIDMVPDVALLGIFDFYMDENQIEGWHTLVHVCRKWRIVVFWSPRRLDLRLLCTARKPAREMLDVWPPLPIVIRSNSYEKWGLDNIFAALERNDRVCELDLINFPSLETENGLAEMQQPFPELRHLRLNTSRTIPASFLGGSAPRLQTLHLCHIPFPSLPNLLLSATHLVHLTLRSIPHSGYVSPKSMLSCLSVLTRLETFEIGFNNRESRPDQRSQDPSLLTRTLLPLLNYFRFHGVSEYLEVLVAWIDSPLLDTLIISFDQLMFNTPQLTQFINRTPKFKAHDQARVVFHPEPDVWVNLPQKFGGRLHLEVACSPSHQLLSLVQLCSSSFPPAFISSVEHLYIVEGVLWAARFKGDIKSRPTRWLELFHFFSAVKNLYISRYFAPYIARALQELVGERVTEVLPALQTLFLEESPLQEAIGQFVAARQLTVYHWNGLKDVLDETDT